MKNLTLHEFEAYKRRMDLNNCLLSSENNLFTKSNISYSLKFDQLIVMPDQNLILLIGGDNKMVFYNVTSVLITDESNPLGTVFTIRCMEGNNEHNARLYTLTAR